MKVDRLKQISIIRLHRDGHTHASIRRELQRQGLNICYDAVRYHVRKYQNGDIDDNPLDLPVARRARFKNVTNQDLEEIRKTFQTNPSQSARDIQRLLQSRGTIVHITTVKKAITSAGYTFATPRYCQMIRDVNKLKRLEFCNNLIDMNDDLNDVIFTDETSVQLNQNVNVSYREETAARIMRPKPKHPLKVHVYRAISRRGPMNIVIFEGIMNAEFFTTELLENNILPFIQRTFPDHHRFVQDNDPKHTSRRAREFMEANDINWWKFPAESCDLNPIEMVWAQLKRYVARVGPSTKAELVRVINDFWDNTMTIDLCNRYIDHVYKVAPVVVLREGKATGDFPNRLFPENSTGKSFQYFNRQLQNPETQARATLLLSDG